MRWRNKQVLQREKIEWRQIEEEGEKEKPQDEEGQQEEEERQKIEIFEKNEGWYGQFG